jgi:Cof subfamily protein (haloacid dehalogenase superfamily)
MKEGKKIFFSDLDGTLLTSDKRVSEKTKIALDEFVAAGNHFAICTGRGIDNVITVAEKLGINYPGTYYLCFNGALCYDSDNSKVINRIPVPYELIPGIFDTAKEFGVHAHTYAADYMVSPDEGDAMKFYNRVIQRPIVVTDDIVGNLPEAPCKVIAIELHEMEKLENFRKAIMERYGDRLTTVYSNPNYLEVFMKEAGKGSGVRWLAEYLGVPIENTIAAGDEQNDISMIEAAGFGIAMLNATDIVKASADVITASDNDHDGLERFLLDAVKL